jgi:hypothetical protein
MIIEGYIYIQRRYNSFRQCCPIFILLRTVLAASLLALLIIGPAFGQIPPPQKTNPDTKPEPMPIIFIKGSGVYQLGNMIANISNTSLEKLGVRGFDGNETDFTVYSTSEGNVHYILNPNWKGVCVFFEKGIRYETDGKATIQGKIIETDDGSKIITSTAIRDNGIFAILSEKGVCFRNGEMGEYNNLSEPLKVNKIEGRISIIFAPEMNQKVIEIRTTNTKVPGIKIGIEKYKADYIK